MTTKKTSSNKQAVEDIRQKLKHAKTRTKAELKQMTKKAEKFLSETGK